MINSDTWKKNFDKHNKMYRLQKELICKLIIVFFEFYRGVAFSDDFYCKGVNDKKINISHPHMGARHPNGTTGMIVDPSSERLLPFSMSKNYGLVPNEILCPVQG